MVADKVRIKKYQHEKLEQWSNALEINESRFVEDAINFYIRYLEGKHPVIQPSVPMIQQTIEPIKPVETQEKIIIDTDNPDDFDGGLDL